MAQRLLQIQRLKAGLAPFCAGGERFVMAAVRSGWNTLICFEMSALLHKPGRATPSELLHQQLGNQVVWRPGECGGR
jgi:hypothetical protein